MQATQLQSPIEHTYFVVLSHFVCSNYEAM